MLLQRLATLARPLPSASRGIFTSQALCAEPMKKKKKVDVSVVRMRVERKIRKLEKEIRKLKRQPRQLKPIDEYVLAPQILRNLAPYKRGKDEQQDTTVAEHDKLNRVWIEYVGAVAREEARAVRAMVAAQEQALHVLKSESLALYMQALQIDAQTLPYRDHVVIRETPPSVDYVAPDGKQMDVTKVWKM